MRSPAILSDVLARVSQVGRALAPARPETVGGRFAVLLEGRGEATRLAYAREALDAFAALDAAGKRAVFEEMRGRFGVDRGALAEAVERWRATGDEAAAREVHAASEPRSQELIRRLNRAPRGTRDLVAMRAALLRLLPEAPELEGLDADFRHLFASWFNRGFLEMRRIDWNTSAAVLEQIIRHEAVHDIAGWDDLRRRVAAPDRRLYAFFHPAMPGDPLVFVEVALCAEIPGEIGPILAGDRTPVKPDAATTAVFYSISNAQEGLRGVSFGAFLIKQVAEELGAELPGLKTFVTLSPLPGLRAWAVAEAENADGLLGERQREAVAALEAGQAAEALPEIVARYVLSATARRGGPRDPVARFHLGNGARLERINPTADTSARGRANAWGAMVNYLYDLRALERNHEAYAERGEIAAASAVRALDRRR